MPDRDIKMSDRKMDPYEGDYRQGGYDPKAKDAHRNEREYGYNDRRGGNDKYEQRGDLR